MSQVRVRFAPSPTGWIHLGNIRTALFNYLFTKKNKGEFILRIEDTDLERSKPQYTEAIISGLGWLGLNNDGEIYHQSMRNEIYQKHLKELIENKIIYPCYESAEELESARNQDRTAGTAFRYHRDKPLISQEEILKRKNAGVSATYRFAVPKTKLKYQDLVYGEKEFDTSDLSDFVIARSDGSPLYLFCAAVDDGLMDITHVIRGEDGIPNTPRQILIQQALGLKSPQFAHLPLIQGEDGKLLSKRDAAMSLRELKKTGFLPEALLNYLALLGWSPPGTQEQMTLEEMIDLFDLEKVSRHRSTFDHSKLNFFNQHYIQKLKGDEFIQKTQVYLEEYYPKIWQNLTKKQQEETLLMLQPDIQILSELPDWIKIIWHSHEEIPEFEQDSELKNNVKIIMQATIDILEQMENEIDQTNYSEFIKKVSTQSELKGKNFFMPLRIALTGSHEGPKLSDLFSLLGKKVLNERCQNVLKNLQ